jgi:hypothetical protein
MEKAKCGKASGFHFTMDIILRTEDGKTIVPNDAELRKEILDEAHQTWYTVHLVNTKMYQDLQKKLWWVDMK